MKMYWTVLGALLFFNLVNLYREDMMREELFRTLVKKLLCFHVPPSVKLRKSESSSSLEVHSSRRHKLDFRNSKLTSNDKTVFIFQLNIAHVYVCTTSFIKILQSGCGPE